MVEFLEGDPDRPIITGRSYNADQMPPYDSRQGAGRRQRAQVQYPQGKGYNEMSMDDTAGKEKVTIHSQYDMGTRAEHDKTESIGNNETIDIGSDRTETVSGNETLTGEELFADGVAERDCDGGYSHERIRLGSTRRSRWERRRR